MNERNRSKAELVILVVLWYISSSVAVLLLKALFNGKIETLPKFRFPLTVTATSNIISAVLATYNSPRREGPMHRSQQRYAQLIGVMTAGEIGLSNWALKLLTVVLATMMKGMAPFLVMLWGFALGVYSPTWRMFVVVACVCVGLALAVSGQSGVQESKEALNWGVAAQFLSGVLSGLRWVVTQMFVKGATGQERVPRWLSWLAVGQLERPLSALAVIRTTAPYTAAAIAPFILMFEGMSLASWFWAASAWDCVVVGSAVLSIGFCVFTLLWSEYALVKSTSSLTVSIGFVAKEVLVIIASMVLFGEQLTVESVAGFCLVQVGILGYAFQKSSTANGLPQ